jgi:hypothetical protein
MKKAFFVVALLTGTLILNITLTAQEALKSSEEEYYDFLSLYGIVERPTLGYRTLSDSVWKFSTDTTTDSNDAPISFADTDANVWKNNNLGTTFTLWHPETASTNLYLSGVKQGLFCRIYGPEWYNSYNTAAPYGQNDGALWQGRGYNTSLTGGIRLEGYGLELTLKPQVCFQQNLEFEIMPSAYDSEYGYFWGYGNNLGIDIPQRFGNSSFWTYDWGDSEIRYTWKTATIGFGTQTVWLGPAWLNPMLGSNNAGTYPKFDIGLRKTNVILPFCNTFIGEVEGRINIGYLSESDYFDNDSTNDHNMITSFNMSFAPSFIPYFTIGATKVCLSKWQDFETYYLNPFYDSNNNEDQKASIYLDWLIPNVGFEIFGELGVDDYAWDKISNPFHTMVYTVGMKQIVPLWRAAKEKGIRSEIVFEWNNFEMSQDFQLQWAYMGYYSHSLISQGYTQRGQLLGAGSGSFGNSQYLGYTVYYPKGSVSLYFHRNCPDVNYVLNKAVYSGVTEELLQYVWSIYKTYMTIGISSSTYLTKSFMITSGFNYTYIHYNFYKDDTDLNTIQISFSVKYIF